MLIRKTHTAIEASGHNPDTGVVCRANDLGRGETRVWIFEFDILIYHLNMANKSTKHHSQVDNTSVDGTNNM